MLVRVQRPTDVPLEIAARPQGRSRPHAAADGRGRPARASARRVLAGAAAGRRSRRVRAAVAAAAGDRDARPCQYAARVHEIRCRRATLSTLFEPLVTAQHDARGPRPDDSASRGASHARPRIGGRAARRSPGRAAARRRSPAARLQAAPVFTYLANTLRVGDREVPYSLVTALDLTTICPTSRVDPERVRTLRTISRAEHLGRRELGAKLATR